EVPSGYSTVTIAPLSPIEGMNEVPINGVNPNDPTSNTTAITIVHTGRRNAVLRTGSYARVSQVPPCPTGRILPRRMKQLDIRSEVPSAYSTVTIAPLSPIEGMNEVPINGVNPNDPTSNTTAITIVHTGRRNAVLRTGSYARVSQVPPCPTGRILPRRMKKLDI